MRRLVACMLAGGLLLGATVGVAEAEGVVEMHVDVPAPSTLRPELRDKTREQIAKRVVTRMESRLEAAQVKFSNVRHIESSGIQVRAGAGLGRELLRGIVLAPGEFAVRPIRHIGGRWQEMAGEIPAVVELRQEGEALDPQTAYLWSAEREPLRAFLEEVSFEDVDVFLYSTGDGWRTYTVGASILTDEQIEDAEIRHVPTGAPFVSLQIDAGGQKSFEAETHLLEGELAAVLDHEIVAMVDPSELSGGRLNVTPPEHLDGEDALMSWARQVAGRLAAAIPVNLVPSQE